MEHVGRSGYVCELKPLESAFTPSEDGDSRARGDCGACPGVRSLERCTERRAGVASCLG